MKRPLLIGLAVIAVLAVGGAATAAIGWSMVCRDNSCPSLAGLEQYQPKETSRLYAADGRFIAEIGMERRTLVKFKDIPKQVREAFVITEDKRFYAHGGIDFTRIIGASFANLRARGIAQGFSTITMQLARNLFPERLNAREKTLGRKLREAKVARMIESKYSKDRILELYLNQIYLGNGAYGIETASQRYFGKSVRELNLAEAATLAALPKGPERYNPRRFADRAVQRRNTVVELMRRADAISDADASLARAYPLRLAKRRGGTGDTAPWFVEWVRRQLEDKYGKGLYDQGLKVYTTLDLDLQGAAERSLDRQLRAVESGQYGAFPHRSYESYLARASSATPEDNVSSPYLQGAFVALDPRTGAVRALVGGRDFDDSKFDRATQALRQPGSTFKPIVYSTAIQSGRPPSYIIDDSPIEVEQLDPAKPWTPQNDDAARPLSVAQHDRHQSRHGDGRAERRRDGQAIRHHHAGAALSVDQYRIRRRVPGGNDRGLFGLRQPRYTIDTDTDSQSRRRKGQGHLAAGRETRAGALARRSLADGRHDERRHPQRHCGSERRFAVPPAGRRQDGHDE
jgi:penicillin-binding protein 1A